MASLNPLPPSKREKNRYIVYEVFASDSQVSGEEIGKAIWKTGLEFLGELGVAKSGLRVVDFDETKQRGVIKVNHTHVEEGRMLLALVKEANRKKLALRVVGVSGILKKARGKWV